MIGDDREDGIGKESISAVSTVQSVSWEGGEGRGRDERGAAQGRERWPPMWKGRGVDRVDDRGTENDGRWWGRSAENST